MHLTTYVIVSLVLSRICKGVGMPLQYMNKYLRSGIPNNVIWMDIFVSSPLLRGSTYDYTVCTDVHVQHI